MYEKGTVYNVFFCIVILACSFFPVCVQAEIASDNAFEGVTWEKILEDDIEGDSGVVQSICVTENYIICLENYADGTQEPDIVKAYYRYDTDENGDPVEQYSLAKRVGETDYEHANGMTYNPDTGEIAVALYSNTDEENRGCIYLMDAETLEYKSKVKISDDYNILGIDYDEENDRYIIQTNIEGGYSFKILDSQFQVTEDLGEYSDTTEGGNFQDLCVSGDYIITFPLTLGLGIGDHIHMYSISQKAMVSDSVLDFDFENVTQDEPESICELEPGVFLAAVNVDLDDGSRKIYLYKTMVPYNFTSEEEALASDTDTVSGNSTDDTEESASTAESREEGSAVRAAAAAGGFAVAAGGVVAVYMWILSIRRERRRKLEAARKARDKIHYQYDDF